MAVLTPGAVLRKIALGTTVLRTAASLPQTAQTPYFTVSGGRVLITSMIGEVTTAIQAQATTVQLIATPTTGTAVNLSGSTGDINGKEIGATIALPATATTGALLVSNAGANVTPLGYYTVVRTGTIDFKTGASSTGATKWLLTYVPLDDGASVVAA